MREQRRVGLGRGVMKLVDDDHAEVTGRQIIKSRSAQALNGCEYMIEAHRALTANPEFTKRVVAQSNAERVQTLLKNFFSMSDEQQAGARQLQLQVSIV